MSTARLPVRKLASVALAAAVALGGPALAEDVQDSTPVEAGPGPSIAPAPVAEQQTAEPQQIRGYLVAPLQNRSRSAGLSWMTTALATTLAEKLEAHPRLRPAYGAQVLAGLPVLEAAAGAAADQVARRAADAKAAYVIGGYYDRVHWKYEVGLVLYQVEPGGKHALREAARVEAKAESAATGAAGVLDLLDEAMGKLLLQAGLAVDGEKLALLQRRPTRDSYALTLYGRALLGYYGLGAGKAGPEPAAATLSRVCFIDPRFAEAHRMLGLLALELGDDKKAAGQYAYALDLRPDYFAALSGLGRLYRQGGNEARAQEMMDKALRVRPWDVETRQALGELLWQKGQLAEAQAELMRVVAERPESLPARRTLALVHAARGQVEELAAELLRISALAPDDVEARYDLAAAYLRMGRLRPAATVYEELLERRPKEAQAYRLLGDLYRRLDEPERAIPMYGKMGRLLPEDPRPAFLLSATYIENGQEAKAEQVLQDAQQFRRYLGEAWTNLGVLALQRGELGRAHWFLSRAVNRAGARPRSHYNYALVLERMNQPDRAIAELKLAADLDPQDAEAQFALGTVLLKQGRVVEGGRALEEALRLRPDHAGAQRRLALVRGEQR